MWQFHPYSLLLALSFGLNITLGLFILRSFQLTIVRYLLVMISGSLLWTGAYALDFLFLDIHWHRIFISLSHMGVIISSTGAVLTAIEFTQQRQVLTKNLWLLLLIQPLLMLLTVILDPLFHTLLDDTYLATIDNRIQWVQVVSTFTNLLEFGGSGLWFLYIVRLIILSARDSRPPVRNQFYLFLVPYIVIWIVAILHVLGIKPILGLNFTPVMLSFQILWIFFSIGYYKMYDLAPLVRSEIVDKLDEPVVILDGRNRVVDWNNAADHLFANARKYLTFSGIDDFFTAYPELSQKIATIPEKRKDVQWSWHTTNPDKDWEVKAKRIRDRNRTSIGLVIVFHDVTEQKRLECKMLEVNRSLLLGNAKKDRFLSIISHDLRGPLTGIKALLGILNEKMNHKDPEIGEMTQSLVDATESVFSLLENLLEWSKLQRGQEEFYPKTYQLSSIVGEAIEIFELNAKNKDIEILNDVPLHAFVYCDDRMIFTVIRNLISNAVKFSHTKGKIHIETEDIGTAWRLTIKDEGVGMQKDTLDKLFQVGVVIKSFGTQGEAGTGVGLLLCQEFMDKNSGTINAWSNGENGSTFAITIRKQNISA